jgi:hypothetical protein
VNSKLFQDFTLAVEQLAHQALVSLSETYIQTDAAYKFVDRVKDQELKQHLLMGGKRSLNEACDQVLKLEAAKTAAGPPARLWEVRAGAPMGI